MPRGKPVSDPTDLLGRTISRLTVETLGKKIHGVWTYHCRCVCGNPIAVARHDLLGVPPKPPRVQSCGCLRAEGFQDLMRRTRSLSDATTDFYTRHAQRLAREGDTR